MKSWPKWPKKQKSERQINLFIAFKKLNAHFFKGCLEGLSRSTHTILQFGVDLFHFPLWSIFFCRVGIFPFCWYGNLMSLFIIHNKIISSLFLKQTYAAFMRCFGFCLLNFKMWSSKSAKGVSVKTLELYAFTFLARLASILRHQGYLPFDKTGDWFYHVVEIFSLIAVGFAAFAIFSPLNSSYEEKYDRFGNLYIPSVAGVAYVAVPCIILAILFHP